MARFYADEQFPRQIVNYLREMGHDVLTVQEAGKANLQIPDPEVLEFAIQDNRAVLTLNRIDFLKLHYQRPEHLGIIICRDDPENIERVAKRINVAISSLETLQGQLIRVNRSSPSE
ncbi:MULTISPECIES: DUF5615 family PIN-like protein [Spirulina sp. CCY15215]|uniref:DUF5615 family PIN-like protein n=1 Tax=Spirulina sp. CCY15215 TaxID=2767591 RepID=UPI00194F8F41|nr:DUF5615 family PIN-like protein [Spirulina major]